MGTGPVGVAMVVSASRQIGQPPVRASLEVSRIVPLAEICPVTVWSGSLPEVAVDSWY